MNNDKQKKIIIIGAGAAGLTAAETLRNNGYSNIQLLEKELFAGGKCRSVKYENRSYELGAGIIAGNNKTIMDLVNKYKIPIEEIVFSESNLYNLETGKLCDDSLSFPEKISYFWQLLLRYHRLIQQFPKVQQPGFSDCEPELFDNFHHWATLNEIPLVEADFERFFTGFGYGYWENIPAAYTLKYNDWNSLKSFFMREIYIFPEGIQQLWLTIAQQFEVNYNTAIQKIKRTQNTVVVETDKEQYIAEVLLLSCPLDETLQFMDVTETETELFSKIKYTDYRTYVCRLENFPNQTGFIPENFNPAKKGHPVFWYKRYTDSNLYTMYVLSDFTVSDEQIHHNLHESIQKLGGKILKTEQVIKWKYFPHVTTSDMQNGYYKKLEQLQGKNNTYYIGELLNFSTVELTAAYAKNLVERFF